ncbi:MAG: hypothetical protein ACOH1R_10240 [Luteimonas sp.]
MLRLLRIRAGTLWSLQANLAEAIDLTVIQRLQVVVVEVPLARLRSNRRREPFSHLFFTAP